MLGCVYICKYVHVHVHEREMERQEVRERERKGKQEVGGRKKERVKANMK